MVFNATFNNISAISWRSVLLVEETEENRRPAAFHGHNAVLLVMTGIRTLVVIGTYELFCSVDLRLIAEHFFVSLR
jgi:hypothetical protein